MRHEGGIARNDSNDVAKAAVEHGQLWCKRSPWPNCGTAREWPSILDDGAMSIVEKSEMPLNNSQGES
jgi:hypothetical protein